MSSQTDFRPDGQTREMSVPDHQKAAFSVLFYLNKLDPRYYDILLPDLLVIFYAVDVTLFRSRVGDWLQPVYGRTESCRIAQNAVKNWQSLPLRFEMTQSYGWTVTCRSGASKESLGSSGKGKGTGGRGKRGSEAEEEEEEDELDEPLPDKPLESYIESVEALTEDGEVTGTISAAMHVGDRILLNSHSSAFWTVYELRPSKGVILLMMEKVKPTRPKRATNSKTAADSADAAIDGDMAGNENYDQINLNNPATAAADSEAAPIATESTSCQVVKEYKEIRLDSLVGAVVKREGFISAKTYEGLERDGACDFNHDLMSFDKFEEYRESKVPPKSARSSGNATAQKEKVVFQDKGVVVVFQLPCPLLSDAVTKIRDLATKYPLPPSSSSGSIPGQSQSQSHMRGAGAGAGAGAGGEPLGLRDPVWHMQHQAQVREHVTRWDQQRRARSLLSQVDSYICLHRKQWLFMCRLLRSVSRGGDALLNDFIAWTKRAGPEGERRARDCRSAWASVRVCTSSDLPPLATARGYLKARGAGRKKVFFDSEGRLRPEATEADPLARSVLDAAQQCISGRALHFFEQSALEPSNLEDAVNDIDGSTLVQPAAVYVHNHLLDVDEMHGESDLDMQLHKIGDIVQTMNAPCYVTVNDVLQVREPVGDISDATLDSSPLRWVQVLAVDLLFARLKVVSCSAPPPHCWLPSHQQLTRAQAACWIPVSKLWDVSVARLLPPRTPEKAAAKQCEYMLFVTPMPAAEECLALLTQLSIENPVLSLEEKKKGLFKVYTPAQNPPLTAASTAAHKERGGAAAAAAAAVCKEKGSLGLHGLRFYTDAVIVHWSLLLASACRKDAKRGAATSTATSISTIAGVPKPKGGKAASATAAKTPAPPKEGGRQSKMGGDSDEKEKEKGKGKGKGKGKQQKKGEGDGGAETGIPTAAIAAAATAAAEFCLEISDVNAPRDWLCVYRGKGLACQISGLEPATQYRCRLTAANYPNIEKTYAVITTLAQPPTLAPVITMWEDATVADHVRGCAEVRGEVFLPPGCQIQLEGSVGEAAAADAAAGAAAHRCLSPAEEAEHTAREWVPLARTRGGSTWVVGPFRGQSLLLRARVINQEAQPGPPGAISIQRAPEKTKRGGGGSGGKGTLLDDGRYHVDAASGAV